MDKQEENDTKFDSQSNLTHLDTPSKISQLDIIPTINFGHLDLPFATSTNARNTMETDEQHLSKSMAGAMEGSQNYTIPQISDPWASSSSVAANENTNSSSIRSPSLFFSTHSSMPQHGIQVARKEKNLEEIPGKNKTPLFASNIPFPFSSFMAETGGSVSSNQPAQKQKRDICPSPTEMRSIVLDKSERKWEPNPIYGEIGGPSVLGDSVYEKLLPEVKQQERTNEKKYQDPLFGILFNICFWMMVGFGAYNAWTVTKPSQDFTHSIVFAFLKTSKFIGAMLVGSFLVGLLWILFLRRFLVVTIWMTIVLIPASFFAYSIWGLYEAFNSPPGLEYESRWLIPESLLSMVVGVISSYLIHTKKRSIGKSVKLAEISFEILAANPSLFFVCLMILLAYMLFCLVWLAMFVGITCLGKESKEHMWISSPSVGWLAAYFIFMFLWTSSVFHYLERCTISGVVCEWYFHRHDPLKSIWKKDLPIYAFCRSATHSFGSICFAGIVLTLVQFIRILSAGVRRVGRLFNSDNFIGRFFVTVVDCLEGLTKGLNSYSLVYIAYSGTDFMTASKKATELFRRNLISALLTDNLAKLLLLLGVYGVAIGCFLATFTFSMQDLHSPYAWAVSSIGSMLSFFLIRFCTLIIVQIMDSLYVCYVIDIDSQKCHSQAVHAAFTDSTLLETSL